MRTLQDLLQRNARKIGEVWMKEEYSSVIHNWDSLATENAISAASSALNEITEEGKTEPLVRALSISLRSGIVLDLGCGYGRIAKYLLPRRIFTGYIGLDSSAEMLKLFYSRYAESGIEKRTPLLLVYSDIDTIPLKSNSVDNVIVSAVFLHNPKDVTAEAIREIHRVLRPHGKVIIIESFPNRFSIAGIQGQLYNWFLFLIGKRKKNGPVRYFNRREIYRLLKQFDTVEITPSGFLFLPKDCLLFPRKLNNWYSHLARRVNNYLEKVLPKGLVKKFCYNFDVVGVKEG